MIEYLSLLIAIPLGILLAQTTKSEKKIYSKLPYFPILIPALVILLIISFATNLQPQIKLTIAFILITTITWTTFYQQANTHHK